jgi:hypothetical protein
MQFDGIQPLKAGYPIITLETPAAEFDLHNDAELREFHVDFRDRVVRLVWLMRRQSWKGPDFRGHNQRSTVASISLIFSGVERVTTDGRFLEGPDSDTLEFLEYYATGRDVGELRVVLMGSGEVRIVARKCQLRVIE